MKTLKLAIPALALGLLSGTAMAQSTPIPKSDKVEKIETTKVPKKILEGTFSELDSDHTLGSPTAPATMIIYASVTCPHCASWFNSVWPDIKKNYVDKNKLRVVFREFPTAPANIAVIGFQIANCAPEEQFFPLIEHQMKEQDNIFTSLKAGTGKETYLGIAKMAGLENEDAMNTCISSEKGIERINNSMKLADSADIHSVPHFIINGDIYAGGQDYLPLTKHLDETIKRGYSPFFK